METKKFTEITLDLSKISFWDENYGYKTWPIEWTSVLPILEDEEDLIESMIFDHSEITGINSNLVKEVGEGYIESALNKAQPAFNISRIGDLLEHILGFNTMLGIDVVNGDSTFTFTFKYSDEAVEKLKEHYSEYQDYNLSDMTMQALYDAHIEVPLDYPEIEELGWGYISDGFDEAIQKALDEEDAAEAAAEEAHKRYLELVEVLREDAWKWSYGLSKEEFNEHFDRLWEYVDDILEFTPKQLSKILFAMEISFRVGRNYDYLHSKTK